MRLFSVLDSDLYSDFTSDITIKYETDFPKF